MIQEAFRLRYDVYCREFGYLNVKSYPEGVEMDDFDDHAAHFCAYHHGGQMAGYVRLVGADPAGRFPFQRYCTTYPHIELPSSSKSAEVSRLMVHGDYRRRRGDAMRGASEDLGARLPRGVDRRGDSPHVLLSLYKQMYRHSLEHGIRYWYAAMERVLARSLMRSEFAFHQVGPLTDYYGPVMPFMADLRELEARLGQRRPEVLAWMQRPEGPHN